jgi:broad specificity phosphatase PhoE
VQDQPARLIVSQPLAIFVRHTDSTGNQKKLVKGLTDYPVHENAKKEAKLCAKVIVRHKPTIVITSPLQRAKHQAKEIADEAGIPLKVDPKFLPMDLGDWEGKSMKEFEPKLAKLCADSPDEKVPGGESPSNFIQKKVIPAVKKVRKMTKDGQRPVIVTHSRDLRALPYALGKSKKFPDLTRGGPESSGFVTLGKSGRLSAGK